MEEKRIKEIFFKENGDVAVFFPHVEKVEDGFYTCSYDKIKYSDMDKIIILNPEQIDYHIHPSVYTYKDVNEEYIDDIKGKYIELLKSWIVAQPKRVEKFQKFIEIEQDRCSKRIEQIRNGTIQRI